MNKKDEFIKKMLERIKEFEYIYVLENNGFISRKSKHSEYVHYILKDGELTPVMSFDVAYEYDIHDGILPVRINDQELSYHYEKGIIDPYNFFTQYTDAFLGVDYSEQGNHVGIGTVTMGEDVHTVVGVVNKDGVLVSSLLDYNTSNEYGMPYMDPTMFDESIFEIRKDMLDEMHVRSVDRMHRAKVNMKIMQSKLKSN